MQKAFAPSPIDTPPPARGVEHVINLHNPSPVKQHHIRHSQPHAEFITKSIERLLKQGLIRHSDSPWASPIVVAKKPNNELRMCIDYRKVNAQTIKDAYPMPIIEDCLEMCKDAKWMSTMDIQEAYYQIQMESKSVPITAFVAADGFYEWLVMPFGLTNAPATFQRYVDKVLRPVIGKCCAAYFDDVLTYTNGTFDDHLRDLRKVLQFLIDAGLHAKAKKCKFGYQEVTFVGHIVRDGKIYADPAKTSVISEWPAPTNVPKLRQFLGLANYYRRFVNGFAVIAAPLYQLLKKNTPWNWHSGANVAFEQLKSALVTAPCLLPPNFKKPFIVQTDASGIGISAILAQIDNDGLEHPVHFISRQLNDAEKNYPATELECLAVVWAIQQFERCLVGSHFIVYTDNSALQALPTKRFATKRLMRWAMALAQYSFSIRHRPGTKNANADALSRQPMANSAPTEPMDDMPPQMPHTSECDIDPTNGECKTCSQAIVLLRHPYTPVGDHIAEQQQFPLLRLAFPYTEPVEGLDLGDSTVTLKTLFPFTRHYFAVAAAGTSTRKPRKRRNSATPALPPTSSESAAASANSSPPLSRNHAPNLANNRNISPPLSHNHASNLANNRNISPPSNLPPATLYSFIDERGVAEILDAQHKDPVLLDIIHYLKDKLVPANFTSTSKRAFINNCAKFILDHNYDPPALFRQPTDPTRATFSHSNPRLYIPLNFRNGIIEMYHSGAFAGHLGITRTWRIISRDFYWPALFEDVSSFITVCQFCAFTKAQRKPPQIPTGIMAPPQEPFELVSMDFIDNSKNPSADFKYILVFVDHFSRFVIAIPTMNQLAATVARVLVQEVICKYGCPRRLLSDQGSHFCNKLVQTLSEHFGIKKMQTSAYHPQSNGVVERHIGAIKSVLHAVCKENPSAWIYSLPSAIFAANNAPSELLQLSPFFILYGRHPIRPDELSTITPLGSTLNPNTAKDSLLQHAQFLAYTHSETVEFVTAQLRSHVEALERENQTLTRIPSFSPGDTVMVTIDGNAKPHFGYKNPFKGEWIVEARLSPLVYRIRPKDPRRNTPPFTIVHVDRLRRIDPPISQPHLDAPLRSDPHSSFPLASLPPARPASLPQPPAPASLPQPSTSAPHPERSTPMDIDSPSQPSAALPPPGPPTPMDIDQPSPIPPQSALATPIAPTDSTPAESAGPIITSPSNTQTPLPSSPHTATNQHEIIPFPNSESINTHEQNPHSSPPPPNESHRRSLRHTSYFPGLYNQQLQELLQHPVSELVHLSQPFRRDAELNKK